MKRLVANDNVDDLMILFKQYISLDNITEMLGMIYSAWNTAKSENQVDEQYHTADEWFLDYYTSIVSDCIRDAREHYEFEDKYSNLSVEDMETLEIEIKQYIYENKNEIISMLQEDNK